MTAGMRHLRMLAWLLALALAAGATLAAQKPQSSSKTGKTTTYRWVDDQGVVHYGDEIPPQYAGKDREVLNQEGVPVKHLDGQRSADQLAENARNRAAEIRQKQHDSFLVTTYTSVKDIESLRDARLEQLRTQRAAAQSYIESLKTRLGALQSRALGFRPYAATTRRMPDDVAEDLVHTVSELHTQTNALATSTDEETKLRSAFQADIDRYKELHTLHSKD